MFHVEHRSSTWPQTKLSPSRVGDVWGKVYRLDFGGHGLVNAPIVLFHVEHQGKCIIE
jgi:hypothetical protein